MGFSFDLQKEIDWADKYADSTHFYDNWGEYVWDGESTECGHFGMRAIAEAAPELAKYLVWYGCYSEACDVANATYNDGLPYLGRVSNWLHDHAGWHNTDYDIVVTQQDPPQEKLDEVRSWLEPGDIVILVPEGSSGGHSGIIHDKTVG